MCKIGDTAIEIIVTVEAREAETDARLGHDQYSVIGRMDTLYNQADSFRLGTMVIGAIQKARDTLVKKANE